MKRLILQIIGRSVFGAGAAALLFSCETPTQTGALAGAAGGAALGAAIDDDDRGRGALIGGAIGTIGGAIAGRVAEDRARQYQGGRPDYDYPYATATDRFGVVRSPYPPHHLVDVREYPRGSVVVDPFTDQPFRIP